MGLREGVGLPFGGDLDTYSESRPFCRLNLLDHPPHSPWGAILAGVAELDDDVRAQRRVVIEDDRDCGDAGIQVGQACLDHAAVLQEILDADQGLAVETGGKTAIFGEVEIISWQNQLTTVLVSAS
jgi:hypothetical protein